MTVTIGRRELLIALGGAAAWPLAARVRRRRQIGFGEELQSAGWQEPVDQRLGREALELSSQSGAS